MSALERDTAFATFVEHERALLQRCAFLLVGRRTAADDLVSATLADLYGRWPSTRTPLRDALRLLATTDPDGLRLPWNRRARFELVDAGSTREPVESVVTDLGRLAPDQRLVLVLEQVARQPSLEIAAVLGVGIDQTFALSHAARAGLVSLDPRWADDTFLADELAQAVPYDLRDTGHPDDLAHGRELTRRRWLRRGLVAAAAAVVLVLAVTQLVPPRTAPSAAPDPAVTAAPSASPACDKTLPICQASLVRAWRQQMSEVVIDYLDPEGTYFNGTSFYAADETDYLWETKKGSLAVEVNRLGDRGSTEVYLQIATDRSYARHCGEMTGTTCTTRVFQDGNRYTLSNSLDSRQGVEVQYRPNGTDVITAVARHIGSGPAKLDITQGALVRLVQDKSLTLPAF